MLRGKPLKLTASTKKGLFGGENNYTNYCKGAIITSLSIIIIIIIIIYYYY